MNCLKQVIIFDSIVVKKYFLLSELSEKLKNTNITFFYEKFSKKIPKKELENDNF